MARIRSVKPELRTSQLVASWPFEIRYFWVLFWGYLDDRGRGIDSPKAIAGDCFPWDEKVTAVLVNRWLTIMTKQKDGEPGPVCRYEVDGKRYLHAVNWTEHQRINRPTPSRLPQCPVHEGLSESLTDEFTQTFTEPLNVGAAEQQSRGAGEQQQREPRESLTARPPRAAAAAEKMILEALVDEACSADEAAAIAAKVIQDRKPRNPAGLVRTIITAGELPDLLADLRKRSEAERVKAQLVEARAGPPCTHGEPGGNTIHPVSQQAICPLCRAEELAPP